MDLGGHYSFRRTSFYCGSISDHDILTYRRGNFDCSGKGKQTEQVRRTVLEMAQKPFQNYMKSPRRLHDGREQPVPVGMGPHLEVSQPKLEISVIQNLPIQWLNFSRTDEGTTSGY